MAKKDELREIRTGTIINVTSNAQEKEVIQALIRVVAYLERKFNKKVTLVHEKRWFLRDIVSELRHTYPETKFHYHLDTSFIRPDGGILYIRGQQGDPLSCPILIAEAKEQGTNVQRAQEGLPK